MGNSRVRLLDFRLRFLLARAFCGICEVTVTPDYNKIQPLITLILAFSCHTPGLHNSRDVVLLTEWEQLWEQSTVYGHKRVQMFFYIMAVYFYSTRD